MCISQTFSDTKNIKQAYKEYREAGNPPILGEDGDEIVYE